MLSKFQTKKMENVCPLWTHICVSFAFAFRWGATVWLHLYLPLPTQRGRHRRPRLRPTFLGGVRGLAVESAAPGALRGVTSTSGRGTALGHCQSPRDRLPAEKSQSREAPPEYSMSVEPITGWDRGSPEADGHSGLAGGGEHRAGGRAGRSRTQRLHLEPELRVNSGISGGPCARLGCAGFGSVGVSHSQWGDGTAGGEERP